MSAPRTLEEFEDILAEYMDGFTSGRNFKRTFQEQADSLWVWWKDNRNYLPVRRLIRLHRETRNAKQMEKQEAPANSH